MEIWNYEQGDSWRCDENHEIVLEKDINGEWCFELYGENNEMVDTVYPEDIKNDLKQLIDDAGCYLCGTMYRP